MKNISTGVGLAILGIGIAAHPILSGIASSAAASASAVPVAAAVTATASAQAGPNVIWMGVTSASGHVHYHRMWSDGRIELRYVGRYLISCEPEIVATCGWQEVAPPPGGNGFACRTDINGDRIVDGSDLTFLLADWGQEGGCEPEATYPCLSLGDLADGAAMK